MSRKCETRKNVVNNTAIYDSIKIMQCIQCKMRLEKYENEALCSALKHCERIWQMRWKIKFHRQITISNSADYGWMDSKHYETTPSFQSYLLEYKCWSVAMVNYIFNDLLLDRLRWVSPVIFFSCLPSSIGSKNQWWIYTGVWRNTTEVTDWSLIPSRTMLILKQDFNCDSLYLYQNSKLYQGAVKHGLFDVFLLLCTWNC